ncbi:MAG: 2-phosphosulfolactate phosphatase [Gaiellaceae bacterium]
MHVHVAFTPAEAASAPLAIAVDVIRATSTIAQALAAGYERVLCCAEIGEALALKRGLPGSLTAGERLGVKVPEFDQGVSPRDYLHARGTTLILSTTNGTRAILDAAQRSSDVWLGSLLNLEALTRAARERGEDVVILCAGFQGTFALDDAYCAGRIVRELHGDRSDAAIAAELVAEAFPDAPAGLNARTYGPPGLEEDIRFCAQESILDVVPSFAGMEGPAAVVVAR